MTSNAIYSVSIEEETSFQPTFLYIKQHSVTGKLYFGKTTKTGPEFDKYKGSGKKWLRHIQKYGKEHVTTIWFCLYYSLRDISDAAILMSEIMGVTENNGQFLNLIPETGINGGSSTGHGGFTGKKHTEEYKEKLSLLYKGVPRGDHAKENMSKSWTAERKEEHISAMLQPERRAKQVEIARIVGKRNSKPKEFKAYVCVCCAKDFLRLEYSHHPRKEEQYCSQRCAILETISRRTAQKISCLHCRGVFDPSSFSKHISSKLFISETDNRGD